VLATIRVRLSDGRERLLSAEVSEVPDAPEQLLGHFERDGKLALGDREVVPFELVERVEFAPPEPESSPPWFVGLHDEDVAAAMDERFERPPYEPE
jgi:hypothetical protein